MAAPGYIQMCTEVDSAGACVATAWVPPPSLLPAMSVADSLELLQAAAVVFVVAWGWKFIGRRIRD